MRARLGRSPVSKLSHRRAQCLERGRASRAGHLEPVRLDGSVALWRPGQGEAPSSQWERRLSQRPASGQGPGGTPVLTR